MTALVPYWSAGTALMWESSGGDLHPLSHHTERRSPFTGGNCVVWTWLKWPWAEGQGTLPLWMLQQMISVNVSYYDRMGYYVLTEINCLIKFCIFWYNEIPFHYKPRYKCLSKLLGLYKSPEQVPWHWFSRWTSIGGWMPSHMMIPTLPYVSIGLKLQRQQLIIIWVYCLAATSSGHSHFEGS